MSADRSAEQGRADGSTDRGSDPLEETQLRTESVFDGAMLHVRRDAVRLPDGTEAVREYVRHPGAVVIIAVLPDGRLLFERQFRYPLHKAFFELPAGKIDTGEDILECARRELREETGHVATLWEHLGVIHPCIGYSDERIEIFMARDLTEVGHARDKGEFLEVLSMAAEEAEQAVIDGLITDGKTISALFFGLPRLRRQA